MVKTETKAKAKVKRPEEWCDLGKGIYKSSNVTFPRLSPGTYEIKFNEQLGLIFVKKSIKTDKLIEFPDMVQDDVVKSIEEFWSRKDVFEEYGQLHKRGLFIYGPPGSGKTCTINILSNKLVALGGIVVYCTNPYLATEGLNTLRRIETDRPIIYVMEDIDEMLRQHGDQSLLSLLDGENKIENIVYVATSNYPELLNERFLDRPSRFDELIEVGMPSPEARGIYLRSVMNEEQLAVQELHQWVSDTDNFSIAHLRELFVSVKCLGREYGESLSRLKGMSVQPKSKKRKSASSLGFNEPSKQSAMGIKFPSSPVPELFRK